MTLAVAPAETMRQADAVITAHLEPVEAANPRRPHEARARWPRADRIRSLERNPPAPGPPDPYRRWEDRPAGR